MKRQQCIDIFKTMLVFTVLWVLFMAALSFFGNSDSYHGIQLLSLLKIYDWFVVYLLLSKYMFLWVLVMVAVNRWMRLRCKHGGASKSAVLFFMKRLSFVFLYAFVSYAVLAVCDPDIPYVFAYGPATSDMINPPPPIYPLAGMVSVLHYIVLYGMMFSAMVSVLWMSIQSMLYVLVGFWKHIFSIK